ncbi:MAG: HAD family phosphatase [Clostridia bacterium]|nr:HAD family phosphatase [Clostridia bacterium]
MYKLIAFDLDGTLTQHRSKLGEENRKVLTELSKRYKLILVGAGGCERIFMQMNEFPIDIIGYYGMQESVMRGGKPEIIRSEFYTVDKDYFTSTCEYLRQKYGYTQYKGDAVEFHATGAVTFPLLGKSADIADKVAFDPNRKKRAVMYEEVCSLFKGFNVFIGGSSSFDIVKEQFNKYNALMRYMSEHNLNPNEVMYVGDDFGVGGNDEHVKKGGLNYTFIDDYTKLGERLSFLLK